MNTGSHPMASILDSIAEAYALPDSYGRCVEFMLSGLELIRDQMPEIARDALGRAARYWADHDQDVSLRDTKVLLWEHLDRMARSQADDEREESALRAVLFVLDVRPATKDTFELLDWFVQFLCGAGAHEAEVSALLRAKFPLARPA